MHRERNVKVPGINRNRTNTVWRSMCLPPKLDLWVMIFCMKNKVSRAEFTRQCLLEALRKHDPDSEPSGTEEEIVLQRWNLKGSTGDGRMTRVEDSWPYIRAMKRKSGNVVD